MRPFPNVGSGVCDQLLFAEAGIMDSKAFSKRNLARIEFIIQYLYYGCTRPLGYTPMLWIFF